MANAVIVVDMLRGFLEEGHPLYCGNDARRVIPAVKALLDRELAKGSALLFVCDAHVPEDPEIATGVCPPHCMKGTREAEIVPELAPYAKRGEVFEKHVYSGFSNYEFERRLQKLRPDKLIIVGVATDVCVLHTTAGAFFRRYAIEVPEDCVASFSDENHRFGLDHLRKFLAARAPRTDSIAGTRPTGGPESPKDLPRPATR